MIPLDLSAPRYRISADAGDNIAFSFNFANLNTNGYTLNFLIYPDPDGPVGTPVTINAGNGLTNTPGASSVVSIALARSVTLGQAGTTVWTELERADTGFERTYAKGQMVLS